MNFRLNQPGKQTNLVGGVISEMPPGKPFRGHPNLTSQPLMNGFSPVRE